MASRLGESPILGLRRAETRLKWRHVGVKLAHAGPGTDLCWLMLVTLDACWPVLAQVGATLSL